MYRYSFSKTAERYFERIETRRQQQVAERLRAICTDPYDRAFSKALHGPLAGWRSSDLGNLSILFSVDDQVRILDIIDIGPRGDIYKR